VDVVALALVDVVLDVDVVLEVEVALELVVVATFSTDIADGPPGAGVPASVAPTAPSTVSAARAMAPATSRALSVRRTGVSLSCRGTELNVITFRSDRGPTLAHAFGRRTPATAPAAIWLVPPVALTFPPRRDG